MTIHQLYLNGEWVRTPRTMRVVNPPTEQVISEVCSIDRTMLAKSINEAGLNKALEHIQDATRRGARLKVHPASNPRV
jgi:hypothetical protein